MAAIKYSTQLSLCVIALTHTFTAGTVNHSNPSFCKDCICSMNKAMFSGLDAKGVQINGVQATQTPGLSETLQKECQFDPLLGLLMNSAGLIIQELIALNSKCPGPTEIAKQC
jgi:hypothetical protein